MKYIKLFEDLFEDNLQDFCDTYLAYLKDEGFNIYINSAGWKDGEITISHPCDSYNPFRRIDFMLDDFSWNEVKDHIIPFLQMLYKEYNYDKSKDNILFFTSNSKHIIKSFDDITNDKVFILADTNNTKNIKKIIIKKPSEN